MKIRTFFDPDSVVRAGQRGSWWAYVFDEPGHPVAGATEPEAVGRLIMSSPARFGGTLIERDERSLPNLPPFLRSSEPTD